MSQKTVPGGKKFMVFKLGNDLYATPLYQVKEVIGQTRATPVPHAREYFKGMINLRGRVISIMDLRIKFGISTDENAQLRSCIIISEINDLVIGTIVDDVIEVVNLEKDQIETHLCISSKVTNACVVGVVKSETKDLTVLLDLSKILSEDEIDSVRKHTIENQAA